MPKPPKGDKTTESDMQAIGHQLGSLASVLVVAAVQFGIPLTPGQQSSILSIIAVAWAFFATIYGIRHRIPRRTTRYDPSSTTPTTQPPTRQRRSPQNRTITPATGTTDIDNGPTNDTEPHRMP